MQTSFVKKYLSALNLKRLLWFIVVALIVIVDQITKYLVVKNMELHDEISVLKGFFNLYYVRNKGAGLGMLANARWVFMSLTTIIIIVSVMLLIFDFFKHWLADLSIVFIISGGIGNMIDRIFLGEVVDFFQFQIKYFDFIFNVADIFVTFGTILFVIYFIFIFDKPKEKNSIDEQPESN